MGKFSKDKRDIYYRLAKQSGYRARSAFKLIHINETFHIFDKVTRVVDLCAAPGGWSEVLSQSLPVTPDGSKPKIVAVDLMEMSPIPGVVTVVGDITREACAVEIVKCLDGKKAHLVVCDGAPDVIGLHHVDEYIQHQLVLSALQITTNVIEQGGTFVSKIFRGKHLARVMYTLRQFFTSVTMSKPKACRNSSMEGFVVCQGFSAGGFKASMTKRIVLDEASSRIAENTVFTFKACGSHTWDSDQSYPLSKSKTTRDVGQGKKSESQFNQLRPAAAAKARAAKAAARVSKSDQITSSRKDLKAETNAKDYQKPSAPPIDPPYKKFLELRRKNMFQK